MPSLRQWTLLGLLLPILGTNSPLLGYSTTLPPISLTLTPRLGMAPATFRARITTPRDPTNRVLCYGFEGPEYYRHCESLDGEQSPVTHTTEWRDLRGGGEYQGFAELIQVDEEGKEHHHTAVLPFQVLGVFQ